MGGPQVGKCPTSQSCLKPLLSNNMLHFLYNSCCYVHCVIVKELVKVFFFSLFASTVLFLFCSIFVGFVWTAMTCGGGKKTSLFCRCGTPVDSSPESVAGQIYRTFSPVFSFCLFF